VALVVEDALVAVTAPVVEAEAEDAPVVEPAVAVAVLLPLDAAAVVEDTRAVVEDTAAPVVDALHCEVMTLGKMTPKPAVQQANVTKVDAHEKAHEPGKRVSSLPA
jgi:hypothetical protein